MASILIRHTVADYGTWKSAFTEHGTKRKSAGSKGVQVFQSAENPNEVTVLLEWDTLENARKFTEDPSLHEVMQKAGVQGRPEVSFLKGGERQAQ